MADVTLTIDKDEAAIMLGEAQTRQHWLTGELVRVNANIEALKKLINPSPITERMVLSEFDPNRSYLVKYDADKPDGHRWSCSCPSWKYQQGLDHFGWCKHIRRVIREGGL